MIDAPDYCDELISQAIYRGCTVVNKLTLAVVFHPRDGVPYINAGAKLIQT